VAKKVDYRALERKAAFAIIRDILSQVAENGLYKNQHLYVTFSLGHPDVEASDALRSEFNEDITIVLQYEFWELNVDDRGFSVSLAFPHSDETIYVPFSSIISLSDPSEDFAIELEPDFSDIKKKPSPDSKSGKNGKVISLDSFRQ
jgi:hypothetical protein